MIKSLLMHLINYIKQSILSVTGLWETINCGDEYNFFCKRSQSPPVNATVAPSQEPKGGCGPEWKNFKGKVIKKKK